MSMRRSVSNNVVFIGKLSSRVREDDLRDEFRRYGRIREIDFRRHRGFAFVEYNNSSDARAAVEEMDGQRFEDTRIVVQFKGDRSSKGPANADVCYNCGRKGHWANECKEGNWTNKCYRCGKPGHMKKECSLSRTPSSRRESPRRSKRSQKRDSRSRSRHRSTRDRDDKSRSRSRDRRRKPSPSKSSSRSNSSKSRSSKGSRSNSSKSKRSSSSRSKSSSSSNRDKRSKSRSKSRENNNTNNKSDSPNPQDNNNNNSNSIVPESAASNTAAN